MRRNHYAKWLSWDSLTVLSQCFCDVYERWLSTTVPLCWCSLLGWQLRRVFFWVYFVPVCKVFAFWYVIITNGLHCLPLRVLYVFKVAFLQRVGYAKMRATSTFLLHSLGLKCHMGIRGWYWFCVHTCPISTQSVWQGTVAITTSLWVVFLCHLPWQSPLCVGNFLEL